MAGRGAPPQPADQRARRNKDTIAPTVVEFVPCAQPALDPAVYDWPKHTLAWWDAWGRSPMAPLFGQTDWHFLADTAMLHALAYASARSAQEFGTTMDVSLMAELRRRRCP